MNIYYREEWKCHWRYYSFIKLDPHPTTVLSDKEGSKWWRTRFLSKNDIEKNILNDKFSLNII